MEPDDFHTMHMADMIISIEREVPNKDSERVLKKARLNSNYGKFGQVQAISGSGGGTGSTTVRLPWEEDGILIKDFFATTADYVKEHFIPTGPDGQKAQTHYSYTWLRVIEQYLEQIIGSSMDPTTFLPMRITELYFDRNFPFNDNLIQFKIPNCPEPWFTLSKSDTHKSADGAPFVDQKFVITRSEEMI